MRIANPTGRRGEELASEFLKKKGYKIIDRNFRRGYGEIDIIAVKDKTLVFVEVKTANSTFLISPLEHINYFKLKTLIRSAEFYKSMHPELPSAMRIDAVAVQIDSMGNSKIEHIENISV